MKNFKDMINSGKCTKDAREYAVDLI